MEGLDRGVGGRDWGVGVGERGGESGDVPKQNTVVQR